MNITDLLCQCIKLNRFIYVWLTSMIGRHAKLRYINKDIIYILVYVNTTCLYKEIKMESVTKDFYTMDVVLCYVKLSDYMCREYH